MSTFLKFFGTMAILVFSLQFAQATSSEAPLDSSAIVASTAIFAAYERADGSLDFEALRANFSCVCRALDQSNPSFEHACRALGFGPNCRTVGSIVCIPQCN